MKCVFLGLLECLVVAHGSFRGLWACHVVWVGYRSSNDVPLAVASVDTSLPGYPGSLTVVVFWRARAWRQELPNFAIWSTFFSAGL